MTWYPLSRIGGAFGDGRNQFDAPLTFGPRDGTLDTAAVTALGQRLRAAWAPRWFAARLHTAGYVRRGGPVAGIHKTRNFRQFRSPATSCERRLAALVLREEGEVAARPTRTGSNLPSAWDDCSRHRERGWKAQGKRAKSWDGR